MLPMLKENVLLDQSKEKNRLVNNFLEAFLGHNPSVEERRRFTIMNRLNESLIYFKGQLIGHLRYYVKDNCHFAEYL